MPLVEKDGKFYCPTCGEELSKDYKMMVERGKEFCDWCISNSKYNPRIHKLMPLNYY